MAQKRNQGVLFLGGAYDVDLANESFEPVITPKPAANGGVTRDLKVEHLRVGDQEVRNFDSADPETQIAAELMLSEQYGVPVVYCGRNRFKEMSASEAQAYRDERLIDYNAGRLNTPLTPRLSTDSVVFVGPSTSTLGERIARELGAEPGKLLLEQFPNSESRVEIHEPVRGRHAFVIMNMTDPVNESVMETALLVQALKLADAEKISVILPYFGYSRQDRKADTRPPISSRAVTDILEAMGADRILSVDLHARQVEGFFDGPFDNLEGLPNIIPALVEKEGADIVGVSPDAGGAKRAQRFAAALEGETGIFAPLVLMSKFRPAPNVPPQVALTVGHEFLEGKTCVLVDDMIDTGGSIVAAARELKERGAGRVIVCATHGIFSRDAIDTLHSNTTETESGVVPTVDRVFVTDTLPINRARSEFLNVVSLAPLIAESIVRLDQRTGSLGDLNRSRNFGGLLPAYR